MLNAIIGAVSTLALYLVIKITRKEINKKWDRNQTQ